MTVIRTLTALLLSCFLLIGTGPAGADPPAQNARLSEVRRRIVAGWAAQSPAVAFDPAFRLTEAELGRAVDECRGDHPEFFWVGGDYSYTYVLCDGGLYVTEYRPLSDGGAAYRTDTDESARLAKRLWTEADKLLSETDRLRSPQERERVIHDRLLARCQYTRQGRFCATAYGAIVEGRANCEGYARALQYLLLRAGIPCRYVEGTANGRPHAWVTVNIDGTWLHTDPCWNDGGGQPDHAYFNLSEAQMRQNHQPDP